MEGETHSFFSVLPQGTNHAAISNSPRFPVSFLEELSNSLMVAKSEGAAEDKQTQSPMAKICYPVSQKQCHLTEQIGRCRCTLRLFTLVLSLTVLRQGRLLPFLRLSQACRMLIRFLIYDPRFSPCAFILYFLLKPSKAPSQAFLQVTFTRQYIIPSPTITSFICL